MNTTEPYTSPLLERLRDLFQDPEYRHAYAESFTNTFIAAQLKANREKRQLLQSELATVADMKQSRISTIENVNYESWSVRTLRRIARAMDLVLVVKLESFGAVIRDMESLSRESLERPSFGDDPVFQASRQDVDLPPVLLFSDYAKAPAGKGANKRATINKAPDVTREFEALYG